MVSLRTLYGLFQVIFGSLDGHFLQWPLKTSQISPSINIICFRCQDIISQYFSNKSVKYLQYSNNKAINLPFTAKSPIFCEQIFYIIYSIESKGRLLPTIPFFTALCPLFVIDNICLPSDRTECTSESGSRVNHQLFAAQPHSRTASGYVSTYMLRL